MGARILLVDDDETVLSVMTDMLRCIGGYDAVPRSNGADALSTFLEDPHRFDLVVADHSMPGMTGLQLAKRILEKIPKIPVIVLTGSDADMEPDPRLCVVRKPIKIDDLLAAIDRALK